MDPMLLLVLMSCAFDEAQRYCRDVYTDLVTLRDRAEMEELFALEDFTSTESAWIGLKYTSQQQWQWALADQDFYKEGETEYRNWGPGEPTNTPGEYCSVMDDQGNLRDTTCQNNEQKYILVNELKSWREAQSYCRQFHTDLVSVRNPDENLQIQKLIPAEVSYIGLYWDAFGWSDGDTSSFRNWDPNQPDGSGECVAQQLQDLRLWDDQTCSSPKPFFCYEIAVFKQVLRLELGSNQNLNDPDVKATILQEIQQSLISQGMSESASLQWRQQPDGNIFQEKAES
ncbi:macrophage mannose receptor 1 [Rhinichthys klamathensis goyatoka]|uniref:macrophage mannose receptor 1 n=1 Tax=Rhinichthys klamathensis goyatoka TaxID=3034132 RepID=UPI0024B5CDAF|nr:macrophage mannose receptor 1 [Rhinichthys klamathensis goyatoka]